MKQGDMQERYNFGRKKIGGKRNRNVFAWLKMVGLMFFFFWGGGGAAGGGGGGRGGGGADVHCNN